MQRPVQLKKSIGFILFILVFFLSVTLTARAEEKTLLTRIEKKETPTLTRIVLSFSHLPQFRSEHSGQRVDLFVEDAQASPELHNLPEDEKVVKIILTQKPQRFLISILLRRSPEQVETHLKADKNQLIMDIYWAESNATRPSVAFRIADMPVKKAGHRAARFQQASPWQDRWYDFFRYYRSAWTVQLPLNFRLHPLPALIRDEKSPLWPLQEYADNGMFLSLIQAAAALTDLDQQQVYLRDLMLAEAQLRTGAVAAGLARLDDLIKIQGDEQARVEYLTAYGTALEGSPLVARIQLRQLRSRMDIDDPLLPFVQLLLAETALAAQEDGDALRALRDLPFEWPDTLLPYAELRTADALAGSGEGAEALTIYQQVEAEPELFDVCLFSAGRAADTAFSHQEYLLASRLYRRLIEPLKDQPEEAMALFASGAAAYEAGDLGWGMIELQRATLEHPDTEGGDRAALRLLDLKVVKDGELGLAQVVPEYAGLGQTSQYRPVREESLFKQALGLYLLMDYRQSVDDLMTFRRDYRNSPLQREVVLLLQEQIPKVVHQLLAEKNDLQAVVLVEQNRNLLLRSGFDKAFLYDVASAFERLGLYERAGRALLYLFDQTAGQADQQAVYLPLVRSYLKREEYQQASEYAGRYLNLYPQGDDAGALFSLLLDAFDRQGKNQELLDWLNQQERPRSVELEVRAAWIYWKLGQWGRVIDSLEWVRNSGQELEVKEMALLGEAYYQERQNRKAENIYRGLFDDQAYAAQAKYRFAQLLLRRQERGAALNLLDQLVAEDTDSSWAKLARDLLIQEQR
ncbi:MAG: hypothetical protein JXQ81_10045 [Desulfuromonadales bacterium]|nr:hypothetical protein [Desulfuromonadales bacterium]MBN2792836.1 hypothetical protein [Desulfuromonadales bacterium]